MIGVRIVKLIVAGAGMMLLVSPVSASMDGARDPSDVRGRLDIKRISHGHADGDTLWHKVVMHRRWGAAALNGPDRIVFHFSKDGERRYDEMQATVDQQDGKLVAHIYAYVEGDNYASVGPSREIPLTRPTKRSVKIFFSIDRVKRRSYAWSVSADDRERPSRRCRRECSDYAPGHNPDRFIHNL